MHQEFRAVDQRGAGRSGFGRAGAETVEALRVAKTRMTPQTLEQLEKLMVQIDSCNGTLLEAAALDLEFHRILWKAAGNPYLERALNALMVPLIAQTMLEHVTKDVRR